MFNVVLLWFVLERFFSPKPFQTTEIDWMGPLPAENLCFNQQEGGTASSLALQPLLLSHCLQQGPISHTSCSLVFFKIWRKRFTALYLALFRKEKYCTQKACRLCKMIYYIFFIVGRHPLVKVSGVLRAVRSPVTSSSTSSLSLLNFVFHWGEKHRKPLS